MKVNVHQYTKEHFFEITGASYIGTPRSNTAVFVSKKLAQLVGTLAKVEQCLVFAEERMDIPQQLAEKHAIVYSSNPQGAYAQFTEYFAKEEQRIKAQVPYRS